MQCDSCMCLADLGFPGEVAIWLFLLYGQFGGACVLGNLAAFRHQAGLTPGSQSTL